MEVLNEISASIMKRCYILCDDYGLAILLFTFLSKIVLLPIAVWLQKNSIKMIKMQPEINMIKVNFFGDGDTITEEISKLYKRENYKPLLTLIPTIIQLILLMAVIAAINTGMKDTSISMMSFGVNLSLIPAKEYGWFILSPVLAGLAAFVMAWTQNLSNVIQSTQSKFSKNFMVIFSVGLSLYLGWFVAVGVALYWIASNLLAVVQLYALNAIIKPRSYIDYDAFERSKAALAELQNIGNPAAAEDKAVARANARREKQDYKRFFNVVNKHLVFYSESSGFYKYFRGIIEFILDRTNITIHYVTSDSKDAVFSLCEKNQKLRAYYIGPRKLITLMMKLDTDVMVMTMPDLDKYHIKKSYVRKDIEYIYMPHGLDSSSNTLRKGALDSFTTIFCVGKHQKQENIEMEILRDLPKKNLVECGYPLLDEMLKSYTQSSTECLPQSNESDCTAANTAGGAPSVLIAPSWQKDNIMDLCIEEILDNLTGRGYRITVRPHPQYMRHKASNLERLNRKYSANGDIAFQTDFSSTSTVFEADLLITDWSGIAYEYTYTTKKPALFINTPMKVMNPEYDRIESVPLNILLRNKVGKDIDTDRLSDISEVVDYLLKNKDAYSDKISTFVQEYVYNIGNSSEIGAKYIINTIKEKAKIRKEQNNEKNHK